MPKADPGLRFERLGQQPGALDIVARWWFDEWAHESPGMTLEGLRARVRDSIPELLPATLLAYASDELAGVAELKAHELRQHFPERTPWLGGVFVDPAHRRDGIAARLVREIERIARGAGFRRLWLQTERLDGGVYARLGWMGVHEVTLPTVRVLVMTRDLTADHSAP
ncbi:MAG TPA: GNAT family N-acetyltransferase [Pseudomonadales bacterium]|nr:GNAT family N-acetyltransferase [Pseudomonadales bacterium]